MRTTLKSLVLLALLGTAAHAFVYENAEELQSDGDFNGDGRGDLLIVDRATGNYRVGYRLVTGDFTWATTRASGIAPATDWGSANSTR